MWIKNKRQKKEKTKSAFCRSVLGVVMAGVLAGWPVVMWGQAFKGASKQSFTPTGGASILKQVVETKDRETIKGLMKRMGQAEEQDKRLWEKTYQEWKNVDLWLDIGLPLIDSFLQNFAKKAAVLLATAGKGQKPIAWTQNMQDFLRDSADIAAGDFIEGLSQAWSVDLCRPDLSLQLKISIGLFQEEVLKKPKCTLSEMVNNWDEAVNDPDFLKNFSLTFEPRQTDIGQFLYLESRKEAEKAAKQEADKQSRGSDSFAGLKGLSGTISDDIISPVVKNKNILEQEYMAINLGDLEKGLITFFHAEKPGIGNVLTKTLTTFLSSLTNKLIEDYVSGTFTVQDLREGWDEFCERNPDICEEDGGGGDLTDPFAQEVTGGKLAAEIKYSKYIKTTILDSGAYEILPELSSCTDPQKPGPTTCVIDTNFSNAISSKKTVQEAINDGLLDGDKIFGYKSDGYEPSYLDGYPYRSLVILRKYRIVPVGWELAAQYYGEFGNKEQQLTLNRLIDEYDDESSPYYGLVDPDWVLKSPAGYCKARGFGPELLSDNVSGGNDANGDGDFDDIDEGDTPPTRNVVRSEQYCADEQSCIKENIDGSCQYYGYCTEEKRTWKFDGDGCEEQYNTCQAFTSPKGGTVAYLKNSLDWDDCSVDNSGCQWYCDDFNPDENVLAAAGAVSYWSMDELSGGGSSIVDEIGGNDGNLEGDVSLANGRWGKALKFGGNDDFIEVENSQIDITDEITVESWIKDEGTNASAASSLIDKNNNFRLYFNNFPNIVFQLNHDGETDAVVSYNGGGLIDDGDWHYIAVSYSLNTKKGKIYIDGVLKADEERQWDALNSTDDKLIIGKADISFYGYIDELTVYDRALSDGEIWNSYVSYTCLDSGDKIYLSDSAESCDAEDAGCDEYRVPESGLAGYWQFDKGEGDIAYDGSGYRNEGDLNSGPEWVGGKIGQALKFNGTNYIKIKDSTSLDITDALTLAAWIKPTDNIGAESIIEKWGSDGDSYGLRLDNANPMFFLAQAGDIKDITFADLDIVGGEWNYLTVTWDGSTMRGYLNGDVSENTMELNLSIDSVDQDVYIGSREGVSNFFEGAIDEVAVYSRALNDSEIANLANGINFSVKYIKTANKGLHCFGRTAGSAIFDLPAYAENCLELGEHYDSYGEGDCFEFLYYDNEDDCKDNNGTWLNTPQKISRHTVKSYCEAAGGVWSETRCQTQCLKLDDPICANYAFACKADERGCEKYTPTNGGPWIPGVISDDDLCPSECAGYDTYKQEATNFENSEFPINFISSTAQTCSADVAGCDEFTNLEAMETGGEGLEYYTYLRQCEKIPTESADYQCGDFYTWVGSDATGYQLRSYYLKSTGSGAVEEPIEILRVEEDLGDCEDANDALTNKNCKEFYNSEGVISYHLLKKTITCSDECVEYRKTVPSEFDLAQVCENINGDWDIANNECDINTEAACKAVSGIWSGSYCAPTSVADSNFCSGDNYLAGDWDAENSICAKTDYQAIPDEGIVCSTSDNGCREYTGNAGGNIEMVFEDTFENKDYIYNFQNPSDKEDWDGGNGWSGGELSGESTVAGQHSLRVSDGSNQAIEKWLSATCDLGISCTNDEGCDCYESDFGFNDGDVNDEAVCTAQLDQSSCYVADYAYNKNSYLLSFWAKGNNNNSIIVKITDGVNNQDFGNVVLSDQWQFYTLGPLEFDVENWDDYKLMFDNIKSNGGAADSLFSAYFDNVRLEAISDSIYIIKDSWNTPSSCDQDRYGNPYFYYMLGCDEYTDSRGDYFYLKSFSNLCREEAVGCERLIDTHNSAAPYEQIWNKGDAAEIAVPSDNFVYLAQIDDYSCSSDSIGCDLLGQPDFNQDKTIIKNIESIYKINNPDNYERTLCLEENVGCETFTSGDSSYYFKNPGGQVCEYVQPAGMENYGWYKQDDNYDENSEKCPITDYQNFNVDYPAGICVGGITDGNVCLSGWDNYLEYKCTNGGGACVNDICSGGSENGNSCLSECANGGGYCSNWAGVCPIDSNSCAAFIDPLSDIGQELIGNSSFSRDLDKNNIPDMWNIEGGGVINNYSATDGYIDVELDYNSGNYIYQTIKLNPNKTYTLSGEIENINNNEVNLLIKCVNYSAIDSECAETPDDHGFYLIDGAAELDFIGTSCDDSGVENAVRFAFTPDKETKKYSARFFSGSCDAVELMFGGISDNQRFYEVSLKETGIYYQLDNDLTDNKSECSYVDHNKGCVLFNNRYHINWNDLNYNSYLTYDADALTGMPASCVDSNGSAFGCDADELIKVAPNRVCEKWLYCQTLAKIKNPDTGVEESKCFNIGICNSMDSSGNCDGFPVQQEGDMIFEDTKDIKNLSGYVKAGFSWENGDKEITGYLPYNRMEEIGGIINIPNGDFESASWDGNPEGWINGGNVTWDSKYFKVIDDPYEMTEVENIRPAVGKNVLKMNGNSKIESGDLVDGPYQALSELLPVYSNTEYIISGYINTLNLRKSAYQAKILVKEIGDDYAKLDDDLLSLIGGNDWQLKVADFITDSGTKQIQLILTNILGSEGEGDEGIGSSYFDEIQIMPVLKPRISSENLFNRSCRLYPESDSLSCHYFDDNGFEYEGWRGYCLQRDPNNVNYCLQWWPVDLIEGEGINEGFGYNGRYPLYYCMEAKESDVMKFTTFQNEKEINYDEAKCDYFPSSEWDNIDTKLFPHLRKNAIKKIAVRYSGKYGNYSRDLTIDNGWYYCNRFAQCGDSDLTISSSGECLLGDYDCDDKDFVAVKAIFNSNDELEQIVFASYDDDDDNECNNGGHGNSGDLEKINIDIWFTYPYCSTISQVVTPTGQNKAWLSRIEEGTTYHVMSPLNYSYHQDYYPFGSLIYPEPIDNPALWDSKDSDGMQPLYVEIPNTDSYNDPYQIRAGSPYACSAENYCYYFNENEHGKDISNGIEEGKELLNRLFLENYGVWIWSPAGVCADNNAQSCDCPGGLCDSIFGEDKICLDSDNDGQICEATVCSDESSCETRCVIGRNICASDKDCGASDSCEDDDYSCSNGDGCCIGSSAVCDFSIKDYQCSGGDRDGDPCGEFCGDSNNPGECQTVNDAENYVPFYGDQYKLNIPIDVCITTDANGNIRRGNPAAGEEDFCGVPPRVYNFRISGNKNNVVINNSGFIDLTFNSDIDKDQLPLVAYKIDWGDSRVTSVSGVQLRDREDEDNPHSFTHLYNYWELKSEMPDYCHSGSECNSNFGVNFPCCQIQPKIQLQDNWGWCTEGVSGDICPDNDDEGWVHFGEEENSNYYIVVTEK